MDEGNLMVDKSIFILPKNIGTEKEIMSSWQNQTFVVACDTVSGTGGDLPLTILDQI